MAPASLLSPPAPSEATAESLGAHILDQIAHYSGPQLPCYTADEILRGFFERFGPADGMAICAQAFEVHHGMWRGAPVTIQRFAPGQDSYFAIPLLDEARSATGSVE